MAYQIAAELAAAAAMALAIPTNLQIAPFLVHKVEGSYALRPYYAKTYMKNWQH